MKTIAGYKITQMVHEGEKHIIYRASKDGKKVIIKQSCNEYPSWEELKRIQTEYEILQKFNLSGITKVIAIEKYKNTLLLIFEDIQGTSLDKLLKIKNLFSIEEFLSIAIQTTKALGEIHKARVIHKDIKPHNIVYNTESGKLEIIDFGSASLLSRETANINMANSMEGTLAFISPEQTGRMNRMVDYRTDFYSLGVTFYRLVTGKLPFEFHDALELIHSHIAILPESPEKFWIPKAISEIILKLMSKNAEDRYMSAVGLLYDLEWCSEHKQTLDTLYFRPGLKDVSLQFQIPEKVYGREEELKQLLDSYKQVTTGSTQILLVNGMSGIGKTVLVNEIQKPIVSSKGYYITGKFDPMKRNMPFRAIIYALQDLVKLVLTEKKESVNVWKEKLQTALGPNGRVVTEVVPELELIIGEQPELVELSPNESQNRFNLVFQDFVRVFASREHPLVIFLDDLQWADSPSIHLIQTIYAATDITHLMFILAYRINEVDATHPFVLMVDELRKQEFTIHEVALKPLKLESINQLVADTLKQKPEVTKPFAEIVMSKTAGNPFFVNELLTNLYHKDLIRLKEEQWHWDLSKIQDANISENVIDLLAEKAKSLPEEELNTLKQISCIGSWFYLDLFYQIVEKEESDVGNLLTRLSNYGFITIGENKGKLVHDKVKEAVYGIIDDDKKVVHHYKAGKTYLQVAKKRNTVEEFVFTIVNQLNNAIRLLSIDEQNELLDLNLMAADKAFASSAYEPALNLLKMATELLPSDSWETSYEKSLGVYTKRARAEYLNGNYDEAEKFFEVVLNYAKTDLEKVAIYEIQITLYTSLNKLKEAIEIGTRSLELLGVTFPEIHDPTPYFTKIFQMLEKRKVEDLVDLPIYNEPLQNAIMKLLNSCITPAYISSPTFLPLVIAKMILISLEYGNFIVSPFGYVLFGNILGLGMGNYSLGYAFGKLAINLVDKYNLGFMKSIIYLVFASMVSHWKIYAKENLNYLQRGYQFGIDKGNFQWAGYCLNHYYMQSLFNRNHLPDIVDKMERDRILIERLKHHDITIFFYLWEQTANNLSQDLPLQISLQSDIFDETEATNEWIATNNSNSMYCYYTNKTTLCYIFQSFEDGFKFARLGEPHEGGVFGMRVIPEHNFFDSLTCLALTSPPLLLGEGCPPGRGEVYLSQVKKNQERMKVWAENCEANYGHKYLIIGAELARIEGNIVDAISKYDEAIRLAMQYEYTLEEAIANELAAKFWLSQKNEKIARVYMIDARYAYERWGCKPKVKQLEETFPDLLGFNQNRRTTNRRNVSTTTTSGTTGSSSSSNSIDIQSVLKASQTLSAEIELDKLLENMMKILFQNSGAETGKLILVEKVRNNHEVKMTIEAEGDANKNQISVMQHKTLEQVKLPHTILNYVARAKREVVLDDASQTGIYTNDPYIKENRTKSVMCYPVISQGKLLAIVYLENNLATNVFTVERLEIMKMLSSQLAISIENSNLVNAIVSVTKKKTKIETEMDIACQIQTSLLPKEPRLPGFEVTAYMETADEVGGDYYDVFQDAYGRDWMIIGDVSGHGVPAGLVMMMAQTSVHSVIHAAKDLPLTEVMKSVNRILSNNIRLMGITKYMTITVFCRTTEESFMYAGLHLPLIVYRATTKNVEEIDTSGSWLGVEDMLNDFDIQEVKFNQGDTMLLYTDGITEARDKNDEMLADTGLLGFMRKNGNKPPLEIKEELLKLLKNFQNNDDITFMVIKRL
ncbi:MAG: AAA family ATPase [Leptospiraceae bacterium]|nr:AAA family ATPase [Leptospiraceae bacterium]